MKTIVALLLWLGVLGMIGCRQHEPPPPGPGVNVVAPGVRVHVSDQGAAVNAPGTQVRVP